MHKCRCYIQQGKKWGKKDGEKWAAQVILGEKESHKIRCNESFTIGPGMIIKSANGQFWNNFFLQTQIFASHDIN